MSVCGYCGRPIIWAITTKHKRIPLDPEPAPGGNVRLEDGVTAHVLGESEAAGYTLIPDSLHLSHFATCPHADRARGVRRPAGPAVPQVDQSRLGDGSGRSSSAARVSRLIDVWCDGSCPVPMGPGGWAAIVRLLDVEQRTVLREREVTGYELETTNQRIELQAAAEALYLFTDARQIVVTSDSQYLIRGMNERWHERWRRNSWRNAKGSPVLNRDLWEVLILADQVHEIAWRWVKGHNKGASPLNERADQLAGAETKLAQQAFIDANLQPDRDDLDAGLDHALAMEATG